MIVNGDPTTGEFYIDHLGADRDDTSLAERCGAMALLDLLQRRPIVVYDFDDELAMLRCCEVAFPGNNPRANRLDLELERTAGDA